MNRIIWIVVVALACTTAAAAPARIEVAGPTVVAFFPPVTASELQTDLDTNDALDDFQHYAREMRPVFAKAGIKFHEVYTRTVRLRVRGKRIAFKPVDVDVGYYFITPGRKPFVIYGVATGCDLAETAREYFKLNVASPCDQ